MWVTLASSSRPVSRLEHRAILESLSDVEALAPGLYEMKIDNPSGDPDCHKPVFAVRFEPRRVEDLRPEDTGGAFERVQQVSVFNETMYRSFVSPWVKALANPWIAETLKWSHPMRTSRYLLSEAFNPLMFGVSALARSLDNSRQPLPEDHPLVARERAAFAQVTKALEDVREARDAGSEQLFSAIYQGPEQLASWMQGLISTQGETVK